MALTDAEMKQAVKIHKALGEPTRFKIMQVLAKQQTTGMCCSKLRAYIEDVAVSTLSHHLKQLAECGLIDFRKDGTYIYYRVNSETAQKFIPYILED
ncbi:ArsR/SmtB family transcription factor [Paenibacillus caui]|uniref:ArsR/SmtB family transcription factor n=1 Tax=Paenibacillus caui TaxID=2873927 RepID=UPI001CA92A43|nr:metalloregulator ArsR/SmtB family transcription factor [Paenibacillus caui]